MEDYLTIKELSGKIKISTSKIYKLTCTNRIPHHKVDGRLLFKPSSIEMWLQLQLIGSELTGRTIKKNEIVEVE